MAARPTPNAFVQDDAQVLVCPGKGKRPHAQYQWDWRADDEWQGYSVRAAWREGEPVDFPGSSGTCVYDRYHSESQMVLIASYGLLQTAMHIYRDVSEPSREIVFDQLENYE